MYSKLNTHDTNNRLLQLTKNKQTSQHLDTPVILRQITLKWTNERQTVRISGVIFDLGPQKTVRNSEVSAILSVRNSETPVCTNRLISAGTTQKCP